MKKRKLKKQPLLILCGILILIISIFLLVNNNTQPKLQKEIQVDETKFYITEITEDIQDRIIGKSYPKDFGNHERVELEELRYLRVSYYDFEGVLHTDGELIVNAKLAQEVLEIFYELYLNKYPFTEISLIDKYNADDETSMRNNNTSSFNYRVVTDGSSLSKHSYGIAIDINPLYNPYVDLRNLNVYYPRNSQEYIDRTKNFPGKIDENDLCYKLFKERGWTWGGNWKYKYLKDYQHFEKDI